MRLAISALLFPAVLTAQSARPGETPSILTTISERPHIIGVSHIELYAHDLAASRTFYRDFLGFSEPRAGFYPVNERQYIQLVPERAPATDRLVHVAIETDSVDLMHRYLLNKGVPVSTSASGALTIHDPDGQEIEIVAPAPLPRPRAQAISNHLLHVGVIVTKFDQAMDFYSGILGLRESWRGSKDDKQLSYVNLRVPDGNDYIELLLFKTEPAPADRGGSHHLCLEGPSIANAVAALEAKPARKQYSRALEPKTGVNRKRQVNLFDPDGTRTELMEASTVDGKPAPSSQAPPPR
jgi:lactoylglutathione lyase